MEAIKTAKCFCLFRRRIYNVRMKLSFKYPRVVIKFGPRLLWTFPKIAHNAKKATEKSLKSRYDLLRSLTLYLDRDMRLDVYTEGYEKLDMLENSGESLYIVSNHISDYDPIMTLRFFKRPLSFVAKEETKNYPFVGKAIASIDGLFLPRKDLRASLTLMKELEKRLTEKTSNYAIYPEGTRNKDPINTSVAPFHPGSFKSAMRAKTIIVPMAIYGTFRVLDPGANGRRIPIEAAFLSPIYPKDYEGKTTEEIANLVHDEIDKKVTEFKKLDEEFYEKKLNKIPLSKGKIR